MRHFRANAVIIKRTNDIEIIFYSKEEIYVKNTNTGQWTLFHRYFAPYYKGWSQFRHLLLYEWDNLTYNHCFRLAFRWDIQSKTVKSGPMLENIKTTERKRNHIKLKKEKND